MFKKINLKSEILKYILVLVSGTAIAQIISLSFTPLITSIYTPTQGGELGLFLRIVSVLAAFATLRYEIALPIVKNDSHSFRLYRLAFKTTLIVFVIALVVVIVPVGLSIQVNTAIFYLLIPIAILFLAIDNLGTHWAIRNKDYKRISYARITNSLAGSLSKVGLGWLGLGSAGLIIGMFVGGVLASCWFVIDFFKAKKVHNVKSNSPRNYLLAKEYKEFPLVSFPHVLMDLGRDLLIAVLILKLFSTEDYGLYDLSYRMLKVPMIFIGVAIGQVFFQRCSEKVMNKQDVLPIMFKSVKTLALLSIVPFSIIFLFGEEIFAYVFSEKWRNAGTYAEIMTPWLMVSFINSPISALPVILRKQKEFFILSFGSVILLIATLILPPIFFEMDIIKTLWIVSYTQTVYLLFLIYKIFGFAKEFKQKMD